MERLTPLVGNELRVAIASVFYGQGGLNELPIEIWLGFGDLPLLQIRNSPHGDGLRIGSETPLPYKMGEFGEVLIRAIAEDDPIGSSTGKTLFNITTVKHDITDDLKEISFTFNDGTILSIIGDGDEIVSAAVRPTG